MPNFETKPQRLEGRGAPSADLGYIGDHYTDTTTGEVYAKRKDGWTNRGRVEIHPTIRQKSAWLRSADAAKLSLNDWASGVLDAAARGPIESFDPSTEAGTDVPADPNKV